MAFKLRCRECFLPKPLDQFPPDEPESGEAPWCLVCRAYDKSKAKQKGELIQQGVNLFTGKASLDINRGTVADLAKTVLRKFGGMEEFGEAIAATLMAAEPGSPTSVTGHLKAWSLINESAEIVEKSNDVGEMTDEELKARLVRLAQTGAFAELSKNDQPQPQLESNEAASLGTPGGEPPPSEGAAAGLPAPDANP